MSLAEPARKLWTSEEIFALPDDGIGRELIDGKIRERTTIRQNPLHSHTEARIAQFLGNWLDARPVPRGEVHSGQAPFRLRRDPDILVGIDVAYVSAELVAATDPKTAFFDGPPVLAVEIFAPTDLYGDVWEKVGLYLEVGTVVWVVEPNFRTMTVHRPGRTVEALGEDQELSGEPELPGFRINVAEFFS